MCAYGSPPPPDDAPEEVVEDVPPPPPPQDTAVDGLNVACDDQASGGEDLPIPLDFSASLVDLDGSETLTIEITDVPTGATLTNTAGDDFSGATSFELTADQLDGLNITPPANSDVDFTLIVKATAVEENGGATAIVSGSITVSVDPEADAPTLDLDSTVADDQAVGAAAGDEDQAIDLDVTSLLTDTDSSESLSIEISGVPTGATLNNGTYDSATDIWTLTPGDLASLQITPDANDDTDFQLSVTATSTEADGGDTAIATGTINVSVAADADASTLDLDSNVAGDQTAGATAGTEDQAIDLDISSALTDTDSSETLSVTIWGVPTGASLNHGSDNEDGTWTLNASDLEGLEITPAENDDTDFSLTVTTTATEADDGDQVSVSGTIDVSVAADADAPTFILQGADGTEDQAIDLDITALLNDTDDSESLSIEISGVPDGATLNSPLIKWLFPALTPR